MSTTDLLSRTRAHVRQLLSGDCAGHDWHHIERVTRMAIAIGREENADLVIVELAALLHDVADWKYAGGDHTAGSAAARAWLQQFEVPPDTVEHVAEIIASLTFKGAGVATPMRTIEGKVVQDADRLDAIGAVGIARAFAYGGHAGRLMHDPTILPQEHASFEAYKESHGPTLNHFYEKLLLLRDRMNTKTGRRLAEARHNYLEGFLEEFLAEWAGER